jgi:3-hydroxyisobutyrate dehydrogenase-like beta-hydroxyacid dehydrogenase
MGEGFARRLIVLGDDVSGYDPVAERRREAAEWGVRVAETPAEAAEGVDLVMAAVTTAADLEHAVFGPGGVAESAKPGQIFIDFSTTPVDVTRRLAERLKSETGMDWLDAPVSGGPPAALAGTLAVMVGGEEAVFQRARPILETMADSLVHMGPIGTGQVTKMVNQICVLNNFVILAEALNLAERGGVDTEKLVSALGAGYAGSNLMKAMWPRMIERDFEPAGYLRQVLKDLDMVHDLAHDLKAATPISSQSAELYRMMAARGHEELDGIAILKLFTGEDG